MDKVEYVLQDARRRYREGREAFEKRDAAGVVTSYHGALESLLRWSMVRDGADPDTAFDPHLVPWPVLLEYLDVRAALPDQINLVEDVHALYEQLQNDAATPVSGGTAQQFALVVEQLFTRLWPQTAAERQRKDLRAEIAAYDDQPSALAADQPAEPTSRLSAPPPDPERPRSAAMPTRYVAPEGGESDGGRAQRLREASDGGITPAETEPTHVGLSAQEERRRSAVEAGRKLQELHAAGQEYCPSCGEVVPLNAARCANCGFDILSFKSGARHQERRQPGIFDRLFGRK